jgi:hypothetical protein
VAKSFVELPSTVNELATQIALASTSGKELHSTKDNPLATSQGDDSKSQPDSKSKDGSIDPPLNQGDETDHKENPHDKSQLEQGSDQGNETDPKKLANSKCSWSISSKGCQLPGVEPKDVCGVDGCQSMFHHLCQTEWEIYQYHLDYPNGDRQDCIYNSGGKKQCFQHLPHCNLAINPPLSDQSQETIDNHHYEQSHSAVGSV